MRLDTCQVEKAAGREAREQERASRHEARDAEMKERRETREAEREERRHARLTDPCNTDGQRIEALSKIQAYVSSLGGDPEVLLGGWSCRIERRRLGNSMGQTDVYYFSESGKKFRSKLEIGRCQLAVYL